MKLKRWEAALAVTLVAALCMGVLLQKEQNALADKLIRLHVTANSDREEDQVLKLAVRDRVLEETERLLDGCTEKADAEARLTQHLDFLRETAQDTVTAAGYPYRVAVSLAEESFPTRTYDTFALPAGTYTSLRIRIGDAAGKNWWCLLFPPICTGTALEQDAAMMTLSEEERSLITMDGTEYVIKFKTMELLEKLRSLFRNLR